MPSNWLPEPGKTNATFAFGPSGSGVKKTRSRSAGFAVAGNGDVPGRSAAFSAANATCSASSSADRADERHREPARRLGRRSRNHSRATASMLRSARLAANVRRSSRPASNSRGESPSTTNTASSRPRAAARARRVGVVGRVLAAYSSSTIAKCEPSAPLAVTAGAPRTVRRGRGASIAADCRAASPATAPGTPSQATPPAHAAPALPTSPPASNADRGVEVHRRHRSPRARSAASSFARHADAADHGVHAVAVALGVGESLQHERRRPFARELRPRPAAPIRGSPARSTPPTSGAVELAAPAAPARRVRPPAPRSLPRCKPCGSARRSGTPARCGSPRCCPSAPIVRFAVSGGPASSASCSGGDATPAQVEVRRVRVEPEADEHAGGRRVASPRLGRSPGSRRAPRPRPGA